MALIVALIVGRYLDDSRHTMKGSSAAIKMIIHVVDVKRELPTFY